MQRVAYGSWIIWWFYLFVERHSRTRLETNDAISPPATTKVAVSNAAIVIVV